MVLRLQMCHEGSLSTSRVPKGTRWIHKGPEESLLTVLRDPEGYTRVLKDPYQLEEFQGFQRGPQGFCGILIDWNGPTGLRWVPKDPEGSERIQNGPNKF